MLKGKKKKASKPVYIAVFHSGHLIHWGVSALIRLSSSHVWCFGDDTLKLVTEISNSKVFKRNVR